MPGSNLDVEVHVNQSTIGTIEAISFMPYEGTDGDFVCQRICDELQRRNVEVLVQNNQLLFKIGNFSFAVDLPDFLDQEKVKSFLENAYPAPASIGFGLIRGSH